MLPRLYNMLLICKLDTTDSIASKIFFAFEIFSKNYQIYSQAKLQLILALKKAELRSKLLIMKSLPCNSNHYIAYFILSQYCFILFFPSCLYLTFLQNLTSPKVLISNVNLEILYQFLLWPPLVFLEKISFPQCVFYNMDVY